MTTQDWVTLDRKHCWHPFTPQDEWTDLSQTPLMLESGKGVWLKDTEGNEYIDGNSSIWTNIHGHNHPYLNQAIKDQLEKVAHTSYLGFAHPLASELATRLCGFFPKNTLERCFFSDDGSTAVEVAMKMSLQSRLQSGQPNRKGFICFNNAYHGDTMGAASLGGVSAFFDRFAKLGLPITRAKCLQDLHTLSEKELSQITAVIIEPIIQGVNQMTPWEEGMLKELRKWSENNGIHLILDEVMTGFGRTGEMFACQHEDVTPDFLCLAKGLTAGYMPMAATLTTEGIYRTFLGSRENTFYYGHSYTANPLGCAVAMASLDLFEKEHTLKKVQGKTKTLSLLLEEHLAPLLQVYQIRQVGLIAGIELREKDSSPFRQELRVGNAVCLEARKHQLLTRPILDTIVFMPPLTISVEEMELAVQAIATSVQAVTP